MWLRKQCTERQYLTVFLRIDHQSFTLLHSLGDSNKENEAADEYRRDQLAIALARLVLSNQNFFTK
jgi:hypothetical protein